jgi:multidrug resistance protein MdtO
VELAFVRQRPGDEILLPLTERLSAIEGVLICYAEGRAPDAATEQKIVRFAMLGTSLLRRILRRSDVLLPQYSATIGSVAVLIGRLVDLAATLTPLSFEFSANDRMRFRGLASSLASIRRDLMNRKIPAWVQFNTGTESTAVVPLLGEMERTVTLMTDVFAGSRPAPEYLPSPDQPERRSFPGMHLSTVNTFVSR